MANRLQTDNTLQLKKIKVRQIAGVIEDFAPLSLQENYDNAGLQIGDPDMEVSAVLVCLDVTEDILREAVARECNMIVSHHPLIFKGLKHITGRTATERIVAEAIRRRIAIYAAHTNLDSAAEGVSAEIASAMQVGNLRPLVPSAPGADTGLGVIGDIRPTPKIEFLRRLKEQFSVRSLRFSSQSPQIVLRRIAVCGGAGGSMIQEAVRQGADCYVTGDLRYHDFTSYGLDILLADIGHYESELCAMKLFSKVIRERYPDCVVCFAEEEKTPVGLL